MARLIRLIGGCLFFSLLILAGPGAAGAATLGGKVTDGNGRALSGVYVSAKDLVRKMAVSVLSDAHGRYEIAGLFPSRYRVRVRRIGFQPLTLDGVVVGDSGATRNFRLAASSEIGQQMPANAWLASLPAGPMKSKFLVGCTICHQFGNAATRAPRSAQEWSQLYPKMRQIASLGSENQGYAHLMDDLDPQQLGQWLAANGFGPHAVHHFTAPPAATGAALHAVVTEYDVGGPMAGAHDMAIDPTTGMAWVGDFFPGLLIRINPINNEQKTYQSPVRGGGLHTLQFDRNGILWCTLMLSEMVASFDPKTGQFNIYDHFSRGSATHSFATDAFGYIQYDRHGRLWLSEFMGNAVASLDPKSGQVREYPSPSRIGHPYGIALDSKEHVWYAKYGSNLIDELDPESGRVTEHRMPGADSSPHRITIDAKDRLWTPDDGYSSLVMYDIAKGTFKSYPLPDKDSSPYAARVDGATGRIWVNVPGADAIYRFDPATERFTIFRLPSPVSYTRMVSIDYATGDIWSSLSNLPTGHMGRDHAEVIRLHLAQ